jgi:hypothetical protein
VRLDAAPASYSLRSTARKAVGGVALPEAGAQTNAQAATPPPSIDGKGTLINTYA